MQTSIATVLMRGGTSRGLYFCAEHLPSDVQLRDRVLLAAMGSPDERQIDGVGGAHPLTSKVAVVSPSDDPRADVDYLFLQVFVDQARVSDAQNCGNILAGVGPFALEQQMHPISAGETDVRIRMLNTDGIAVARVHTPRQCVAYTGDTCIDGVPGAAAPIAIDFQDVAGSSCGALFPTGQPKTKIEDLAVTCIDNGMPVVILNARDLGKKGDESPAELEGDKNLRERLESIRLRCGELMNLGDVTDMTIPKLSIVSPPHKGGAICTRTFIPHRVHEAIGVLGAVSVATAISIEGTVAQAVASGSRQESVVEVEHPTGSFCVEMEVAGSGNSVNVRRSALIRTARKLMRGDVFVPASVWSGE